MPELIGQKQTEGQESAGSFYSQPILNSPYAEPDRHWELDASGRRPNVSAWDAGLPISLGGRSDTF